MGWARLLSKIEGGGGGVIRGGGGGVGTGRERMWGLFFFGAEILTYCFWVPIWDSISFTFTYAISAEWNFIYNRLCLRRDWLEMVFLPVEFPRATNDELHYLDLCRFYASGRKTTETQIFGQGFPQTLLTVMPGCPVLKSFSPVLGAQEKHTFWC